MHWTCIVIGENPDDELKPFNNQDPSNYTWTERESSNYTYAQTIADLTLEEAKKDPRITISEPVMGIMGPRYNLIFQKGYSGYSYSRSETPLTNDKPMPVMKEMVRLWRRFDLTIGKTLPEELIQTIKNDNKSLITELPVDGEGDETFIFDTLFETIKQGDADYGFGSLYVIDKDYKFLGEWTYYNFDAFYDWYVIGGRWAESLYLKNEYINRSPFDKIIGTKDLPDDQGSPYIYPNMKADSLPIKAIDFQAIRLKRFKEAAFDWMMYEEILRYAGLDQTNLPKWKTWSDLYDAGYKVGQTREFITQLYEAQEPVKKIKTALSKLSNLSLDKRYIEWGDTFFGKKKVIFFNSGSLVSYYNGLDHFANGKELFMRGQTRNYLCAHSYLYKGEYVECDENYGVMTESRYVIMDEFLTGLEMIIAKEDPNMRLTVVDLHN